MNWVCIRIVGLTIASFSFAACQATSETPTITVEEAKRTVGEGAEDQARPDWLDRAAVQILLKGNTISSYTGDGANGYRYWIHFQDHKAMTWKNDRGKTRNGIWFVSDDDKFCTEWGFATECYGVRHTGKMVRFDHNSTGKERWAAKLLKGDPKNLRNDIAPNSHEPPAADLRTPSDQEASSSSPQIAADAPVAAGARSSASGTVTIKVVGDGTLDPEDALETLVGVQAAESGELADVVWNLTKAEIQEGPRVIAYLNANNPEDLQAVVDRWLLLKDIQRMSVDRSHGLFLEVRPVRSSLSAGEEIVLSLSGHSFEHSILFNIGPNGGIDIIYPTRTDFRRGEAMWPTLPPGLPLALGLVAGPPFGVNHVVAVSSPSAPEELLQLLRRAASQSGAQVAMDDIINALGAVDGQMTVSGHYVYP